MQRQKSGLLGYASLIALTGGIWVSSPASAQPGAAPASTGSQVGEVIVTARRVAENVQKIPVAVSAHTGAQIDQLVVHNVQDLNKLAAGLQTEGCTATRQCSQPSIRGQGTAFGTGQNSVINYFAEAPNFNSNISGPSTLDLASLQVVKGPQGTLFGATATGGVILYEPKRPTQNELNGYVRGEFGNFNYIEGEGAIGGAIIPDVLMWRVAAEGRERHGFTTAVQSWGGTTDADNIDHKEWRVSLIWRPLHNVENYFVYAGSYDTSHGESSPLGYVDNAFMNPGIRNLAPASIPSFAAMYLFQTGVAPPPGMTFAQLQNALQAKQNAAGIRTTFWDYNHGRGNFFNGIVDQAKWDINDDLTVRNIFGLHWEQTHGPAIDVDGGDLPLVDTRAPVVQGTTNLYDPTFAWVGGWPSRAYTDEVQVQGKLFNNRLTWQTGGYGSFQAQRRYTPNSVIWVFESDASTPDPSNARSAGAPVTPPATAPFFGSYCNPNAPTTPGSVCYSQLAINKSSDAAIYGQGTLAILDTLHLTGGVRHSWASRSVTTAYTNTYYTNFMGFQMALPVTGRSPLPGTQSTQAVPTEQRDTYTVALDWQATPDLLLYGTNRTGYKPGGINGNAPQGNPHRVFGPESLMDIELGAKWTWSIGDIRGRTNFAYYHDDYSDIQVSELIPGTATTYTANGAKALIQGFEVEGAVRFSDWFELSGWYSYLDAHYVNYTVPTPCNAGSAYWYTICSTLPATTPPAVEVFVNNANGNVTIANVDASGNPTSTIASYQGVPKPIIQAAKNTFNLMPTLHLKPWLQQDISITANIQYVSGYGSSNFYPGVDLTPQTPGSVQPYPFYTPARTVVDMHIDWDHVAGSRANLSFVMTNVTDAKYQIQDSLASGFGISGSLEYIYAEPRMFYLEVTCPLGGGG